LSPEGLINLSLYLILAGICVFTILYALAIWLSREWD